MAFFYDLRGYISCEPRTFGELANRIASKQQNYPAPTENGDALTSYLKGWILEEDLQTAFFGADMRWSGVDLIQEMLQSFAADFPNLTGRFYLDKDDGEDRTSWHINEGRVSVTSRRLARPGTNRTAAITGPVQIHGFLDCNFEDLANIQAVIQDHKATTKSQLRWRFQEQLLNYSAHAFFAGRLDAGGLISLNKLLKEIAQRLPDLSGAAFGTLQDGPSQRIWEIWEGAPQL